KRGGAAQKVSLDEAAMAPQDRAAELVALDEALAQLAAMDERKGRIVEMKFFGGLTTEEVAEGLKVTPRTIERGWRRAKAALHHEISRGEVGEAGGLAENRPAVGGSAGAPAKGARRLPRGCLRR